MDSTDQKFNTAPLLNKLSSIINNEMENIMSDYVSDYKMYKETYHGILNLPAIKALLMYPVNNNVLKGRDLIEDSSSDDEPNNQIFEEETNNKFQSTFKLIEDLRSEINILKEEITHLKIASAVVLPSCVCFKQESLEKENITLQIEESLEEEEEDEEEVNEVKEEDEEDEEDEEEEEEEEVNEVKEEEDEEENVIEVKEEVKVVNDEEENVIEVKEEVKVVNDEEEELSEEEEEEEELFEIEIDDITYCTNDEENGFIYELDSEGDVGKKVGYLKEGEPFFN